MNYRENEHKIDKVCTSTPTYWSYTKWHIKWLRSYQMVSKEKEREGENRRKKLGNKNQHRNIWLNKKKNLWESFRFRQTLVWAEDMTKWFIASELFFLSSSFILTRTQSMYENLQFTGTLSLVLFIFTLHTSNRRACNQRISWYHISVMTSLSRYKPKWMYVIGHYKWFLRIYKNYRYIFHIVSHS